MLAKYTFVCLLPGVSTYIHAYSCALLKEDGRTAWVSLERTIYLKKKPVRNSTWTGLSAMYAKCF